MWVWIESVGDSDAGGSFGLIIFFLLFVGIPLGIIFYPSNVIAIVLSFLVLHLIIKILFLPFDDIGYDAELPIELIVATVVSFIFIFAFPDSVGYVVFDLISKNLNEIDLIKQHQFSSLFLVIIISLGITMLIENYRENRL